MARPLTLDDLPSVTGVPVLAAATMSEVDRAAERLGIGVGVLMENASRQVAAAARMWLGGSVATRTILVLAGRGNNGGDALGAARHLLGWGAVLGCVVAGPPERLGVEARRQLDILVTLGQRPLGATLSGERVVEEALLAERLSSADLVIDGLLGTSARGAPRDEVAALIRLANRSRTPILAVDLPSGLGPDTGTPMGVAIRAGLTITLALPKPGLLARHAASLVGELLLADIGIPASLFAEHGVDARALFVENDLVRVLASRGRRRVGRRRR